MKKMIFCSSLFAVMCALAGHPNIVVHPGLLANPQQLLVNQMALNIIGGNGTNFSKQKTVYHNSRMNEKIFPKHQKRAKKCAHRYTNPR